MTDRQPASEHREEVPELICAYCGRPFAAPIRSGPRPRYCSPAHRQRAFEQRRATSGHDDVAGVTDELERAHARIASLELDNRHLRQALDEANADALELRRRHQLTSPTLEALTRPRSTEAEPAPEPRRSWRRRR